MQIFGLAYAPVFILLAVRRPVWALIAIFALSPFQFSVSGIGVAFSMAEVNLLLTTLVWISRLRHSRYGLSLGPLSQPIYGYILVCVLGAMITWQGGSAVVSLVQTIIYTVVTVLIFSSFAPVEELPLVLYSLLPISVFWSALGFKYHFELETLGKNAFGGTLAMAFLVALDLWLAKGYIKRPWNRDWGRHAVLASLLIIGGALVLTLSRGAWIGAVGGIFVIMMLRRASVRMAKIAILFAPLLMVLWNSLPKRDQQYAFGFEKKRYNIAARLKSIDLAETAFRTNPVLGVGTGYRKKYDATNLVWSTLAETGVFGFLAFCWIFVVMYRMCWRSRRILPPSDRRFSLLTIGCALMTCKLLHGMVDNYWGRGSITLAWGGLGMTLAYCRIPVEARIRQLSAERRRRMSALVRIPASSPQLSSGQAIVVSSLPSEGVPS